MRTPQSPAREIIAKFDDDDMRAWHAHSIDWAKRMIAIAESSRGAGAEIAWDLADAACKSARGKPRRSYPLPGWFGARARRVVAGANFGNVGIRFRWADHTGVVSIEGVRCFITEPYPWFEPVTDAKDSAAARWKHVLGDFAHLLPADDATAQAARIARRTGCKLLIERVAWHHPLCFRMTFLPLDPMLPVKDAIKRYNPRPLEMK